MAKQSETNSLLSITQVEVTHEQYRKLGEHGVHMIHQIMKLIPNRSYFTKAY